MERLDVGLAQAELEGIGREGHRRSKHPPRVALGLREAIRPRPARRGPGGSATRSAPETR
jgi:hypothetical protein